MKRVTRRGIMDALKERSVFIGPSCFSEKQELYCGRCGERTEHYTVYSYSTTMYDECLTCHSALYTTQWYSQTTSFLQRKIRLAYTLGEARRERESEGAING